VDLVARPGKTKYLDVVGFAISTALSDRTEQDFHDFCTSLVSGYRWQMRNDDGRSLVLENEGEVIRIWPVNSTRAALKLLENSGEYGRDSDLIVSNQTMSSSVRALAAERDWGILHYSEMSKLINRKYRIGVLKDL